MANPPGALALQLCSCPWASGPDCKCIHRGMCAALHAGPSGILAGGARGQSHMQVVASGMNLLLSDPLYLLLQVQFLRWSSEALAKHGLDRAYLHREQPSMRKYLELQPATARVRCACAGQISKASAGCFGQSMMSICTCCPCCRCGRRPWMRRCASPTPGRVHHLPAAADGSIPTRYPILPPEQLQRWGARASHAPLRPCHSPDTSALMQPAWHASQTALDTSAQMQPAPMPSCRWPQRPNG